MGQPRTRRGTSTTTGGGDTLEGYGCPNAINANGPVGEVRGPASGSGDAVLGVEVVVPREESNLNAGLASVNLLSAAQIAH